MNTDDELPEVLAAAGLCMLYGLENFAGFETWLRSKGYVRDEKLSRAFLAHAVLVFEDLVKDIYSEFLALETGEFLQGNTAAAELLLKNGGYGVAGTR